MPILAEVPQPAGARVDLRPRRYQKVRQKGVQSIRSAILGLFHTGGPTTIGFTGLGTTEQGVSELVLDVAHSLAGVGRSVLLIDGQLGGLPAHDAELAGGATLADLSAHSSDDVALAGHVAGILDGCVTLEPNLSVLPGDPRTVDPVDVLASKSFRVLTEQASERYDVVIVVGPSALSPFAYVMAGLVSAYIVVSTVGRTRQQHIEQLAKQFAGSRSRLVGAVLLGVKPRRGWVPASDLSRSPATAFGGEPGDPSGAPLDDEEQGLLDRLGQSLASLAGDKPDK
jgi:Mrp family chromosome partitioning ATPase